MFLRCCTAYRGLLARLGVERPRRRSSRASPCRCAAPGRPLAWIRRHALPAPAHLAPSLLALPAPAARGARCARRTAARASRALDPDDRGARRARASATGSRAQGERDAAIDALLGSADPADAERARRATRRSRSRRRCSGRASSTAPTRADIGWAAVPLAALHDGPARARCCASAGAAVRAARGACARRARRPAAARGACAVGGESLRGRRGDPRGAARRRGAARCPPTARLDAAALGAARRVADREPARGLRPARARPAASSRRWASPLQWIFDRTARAGAEARRRYLAVSLSAADEYVGLSRGGAARALPARVRAAASRAARGARVCDFFVHARAGGDVPPGARHAPLRAGDRTRAARACSSPARGPTPAGRPRWKARCAAAAPPPSATLRALCAHAAARTWRLQRREPEGASLSFADHRFPRSRIGRARRARARPRAPALEVQDAGRLLEGRARDERDDGRRGPAAARVPRHPRARARRAPRPQWIRSQAARRTAAGRTTHGGPADLSTTIEAYAALRLAGDPRRRAAHAARRASWCASSAASSSRASSRGSGSRCSASGVGRLPALPPEVILLPRWFPLNIYDFACWARQTIVPLTVVAAHRPARPLGFSLRRAARPGERTREQAAALDLGGPLPARSTARCTSTSGVRSRRLRRQRARPRARSGSCRRQEADGGWGGIQPPWVYSIMALAAARLSARPSRACAQALDGLDGFAIREDGVRRLEACQSPVWDTVLAMVALRDAGVAPDDPGARCAAPSGCCGEEIRVPRRLVRCGVRTSSRAAGRSSSTNDHYPDVDDTAEVILALRARRRSAIARRSEAALRARDRAGRSACSARTAASRRSTSTTRARSAAELPFCDFGEVIDPPSADVTAHVLEMLGARGPRRRARARERAREWLLRAQEPDGSWFGRWGVNYVYGTGAALPALIARRPRDAIISRSGARCAGSRASRTPTAAWARTLASYVDRTLGGRGDSTPSQTAWALLALLAADGRSRRSIARHRLARARPARGRRLGRAAVHRHGVPGRLLHPLPPLPAGLPADGARALPRNGSARRALSGRSEACRFRSPRWSGGELRAAAEAARREALPARADARAALPLQPRLRRLREDPVPGPHPEASSSRPRSASRPSTSAARRWCRIPGGEPLLHPQIKRDRRGARRAQEVHLPLHQRAAAEGEARPVQAEQVPDASACTWTGRGGAPRLRRLPRGHVRHGASTAIQRRARARLPRHDEHDAVRRRRPRAHPRSSSTR